MADQNNVHTETIKFDLAGVNDTVATLTAKLGDMATITKEAKEGINHVGTEYQFVNKELQKWYDNLKQLKLAHNQTTIEVIAGMQKAAAAANAAATSHTDYGKKIKEVNEGILSSEENKKKAFEDIGRLLTGENFGLRQFAANFGFIGAGASIALFALKEYGDELTEFLDRDKAATLAQKEFIEVMNKSAEKTAEATITVEKQNAEFKDATSVNDRKKALDDYNKTFGDTIGYADTFEKAEQRLKDHTDDYIKAMGFRAQADAAYGLQKEALAKAQKAQVEGETSFFGKAIAGVKQVFGDYAGAAVTLADSNKGIVKENEEAAESFAKIAQSANDSFAAVRKQAGGGTGDQPKKDEKGEHDNSIAEEKRYIAESQKILETAKEKEITNENIKYEKIKADLIKFHHSTEELTEQHNQNLADIEAKYEAKVEEAIRIAKFKAKEDGDKLTQKFLDDADRAAAKKLADDAKSKEEIRKADIKQVADSIAYNKKADQQIVNDQNQTYNQKLTLLKKDLDYYTNYYNEKGTLTAEDQAKQKDDLDAYKKIQAEKLNAQKLAVGGIVSVLNSASEVLGKNTELGKDIAIAASTIATIQGAIQAFTSFSAIPFVGVELGIIAAAAALAAGYANIKKIEAVKVPGGSGGGSSSSSLGGGLPGAPSIPKAPTTTNISGTSLNKINQQQNAAPIKAVVVEQDITRTQSTVAGFQNGSSLH